jgi:hypothetical protein
LESITYRPRGGDTEIRLCPGELSPYLAISSTHKSIQTLSHMKIELFEKIARAINAEEFYTYDNTNLSKTYKLHSLTETDEFKQYMFFEGQSYEYDKQLERAKANLKKGSNVESTGANPFKCYISLKYDKVKDKISLARYEVGYGYSYRQKRYYPHRKNYPLLCYSNHLYSFFRLPKRIGGKTLVRIATPANAQEICSRIMVNIIYPDLKISNYQFSNIPFRYLNGTDNQLDAYEKMSEVKIPQALKSFNPESVIDLIKVLKNPNELNTICQYLSKEASKIKEQRTNYDDPFWITLSDMLFQDKGDHSWLVRDWVGDHKSLGRKLSLKISSKKRMIDEHAKMAIERMAKSAPEIKVAGMYKNMFKKFPIKGAELILDKERLVQESVEQRHCVATYAHRINQGHCAIVSIPYNGEQYTLEVAIDSDSHMYNAQLRGKRNVSAPEELHNNLNKFFAEFAGKPVPSYSLLPF